MESNGVQDIEDHTIRFIRHYDRNAIDGSYTIHIIMDFHGKKQVIDMAAFQTRKECIEWANLTCQHLIEICEDIRAGLFDKYQKIGEELLERTSYSSSGNIKTGERKE